MFDSGYELTVIGGDDKGKVFPLQNREIKLGRKPQEEGEAWVFFDDPTVSRFHGQLIWNEGMRKFILYHKSRTNPTIVNERVVKNAVLSEGDKVQMGLVVLQVTAKRLDKRRAIHEAVVKGAPIPGDSHEMTPVATFSLQAVEGPDRGTYFPLDRPLMLLGGRYEAQDGVSATGIFLRDPDLPREQGILIYSAREKSYNIYQVEGSRIASYVLRKSGGALRKHPVSEGVPVLLKSGDYIALGASVLLFHSSKEDAGIESALEPVEVQGSLPKTPDVERSPCEPSAQPGKKGLSDNTATWKRTTDYILGFLEGPYKGGKIEFLAGELKDGLTVNFGCPGERINQIEISRGGMRNDQGFFRYALGKFHLSNRHDNGTVALNDMTLSAGDEALLTTGDRIRLADSVIIYLEPQVVEKLRKFELYVESGEGGDKGKSFDLLKETVIVGRGAGSDLKLSDPEVSRTHIALSLRKGGFSVEHLSDLNPTFVNGVSLLKEQAMPLVSGDRIQLSSQTVLVFLKKE